ncbi:DUF1642 domain-containing protein [Listeria monocytogenes]|nr:DUF1642 domain-containing protein [Listeria monocytogenes]EAD5322733.1 DUF1642 domain-containing protein [Listeria monocytogenes]EAE9197184.1 DUF1642 domain-containing protein [Listeria monocytogenes]EAE9206254.1 DUF1642 domain-containing protein [Listeria monocytogenes]
MDADKKSVEGGNKMKFEVGERVQFIYAGKLRTGGIKKFTQGKGEVYAHIEVDDTQACVRVTTDNIAKLDQPEQQSEKIKKINEIMLELIHRKDMDILNDDDITKMLIEALNIVNTLDEPKPVVVPKETADFIKTYGSSNDRYSVLATIMKDIINCYSPDTDDLFTESLEKNIQAVLNGYVVEEEQKWVVSVEDHDGQYDVRYFHSFAGRTSKEDFPSVVSVKKRAYRFTEKEKAEAVALLIGGTVEEVEAPE